MQAFRRAPRWPQANMLAQSLRHQSQVGNEILFAHVRCCRAEREKRGLKKKNAKTFQNFSGTFTALLTAR